MNLYPILKNDQALNLKGTFGRVDVDISKWHGYFLDLSVAASRIRLALEYCSHIWGEAAQTSLALFDAVKVLF